MKLYIDSDRKYEKNRKSLQPLGFFKKPSDLSKNRGVVRIFNFFHIFNRNHDIVSYKFGIRIKFCIDICFEQNENQKSEKSKKMRRSRVAISLCLKFGGKAALNPKNIFFRFYMYIDAKFNVDSEFI